MENKEVIIDNVQKLILGIIFVILCLGVCVTVDSADSIDNQTITNTNNDTLSAVADKNVIIINDTYILDNNSGEAISDGKIYTEKTAAKSKKNTVTITAKPSCSRCAARHMSYKWGTNTFINYCPNCKHSNVLYNKHKWAARHEQELTCSKCDSDFCGCCGKEKYSWSHKYITKA